MRGTEHSKVLWCMLMVIAVLTLGLVAGCGKPAAPPAQPPPPPTSPAKSGYETPATPPPSATGTPQTAADPKNLTDAEKKHVPQFALPKDIKQGKPLSVTVNVGQVPHPMTDKHYIEWIELSLDGKLVKKITLKPGDKPMGQFEFTPTAGAHKLEARIFCNLHGLWANTMDLNAK
ncbi:MAG: class II SORL domain-containing protein [Armatimonadota bacterium]